jgi:ring-1,2-phenylacetyl-CoA epoxidase subunit PaaB
MDTQWPRYEVFKQDTAKKPHQAVGSVHAPDADMALQMARDVFVRRPKCVSLWVVSADAILMVTAQELDTSAKLSASSAETTTAPQTYHIFNKTGQRRAMTYVDHIGTLQADSAQTALAAARTQFGDDAVVWWIVPEAAITNSDDVLVESWFAPATDKRYRHQSAYGFVNPKRQERRHSKTVDPTDS